jgi:Carbohydrate esterase, sialic acid-specific acetylesterase
MTSSNSPRTIEIGERRTYDGEQPIYGPIPDATGKIEVPSQTLPAKNTVVVLLGQSNAANFCGGKYAAQCDVANFNLYDGKCYRAADPLLGASGDGGNFATRLGDLLISRGLAKRVVLAPIAMGNTRIEDWTGGSAFHRRILVLIRRLYEAELTPDFILWQQGEGNAGDRDLAGERYRRHLLEIVQTFRDYGISAPFMIAQCTVCGKFANPIAGLARAFWRRNIRAGQRRAAGSGMGTYLGPDTDLIGYEDRFDCCHMGESGAQKQAEMWADAIARVKV